MLRTTLAALVLTLPLAPFGCDASDLLVGDDAIAKAAIDGSASEAAVDASPAIDATPDAPTSDGASCADANGTCLSADAACERRDATRTCGSAGASCCVTACPELTPLPPASCDGDPPVAKYDAQACVVGFGCAPITCAEGGGRCVGLAPGTCTNGVIGDARRYSCGGGLGVECCLPKP